MPFLSKDCCSKPVAEMHERDWRILLFIASRSTSDGSNWTSFMDSSLHSSRNYAQSTTSYSKAVSGQQKILYFMEYPSFTEVAGGCQATRNGR